MIPALLSVVFVAYLYQSLNQPTTSESGAAGSTGTRSQEDVASRLNALQSRVEQLTAAMMDGDRTE